MRSMLPKIVILPPWMHGGVQDRFSQRLLLPCGDQTSLA